MTAEERFKNEVRKLHEEGIYPGPTILNERLHGRHRRNINGREVRWRREIMHELGISLKRPNAALPLTDYDVEVPYGYGYGI